MASIGSVSVSVVPSAEGFTDKLRATLLPEMDTLGDEAGERLKRHIQDKLDEVKVRVAVDNAAADAALDKTKRKADELPAKKDISVNVNNSGGVLGWLVSAVGAAVAIAPAFAVAGVGVAAFTALAVPSIQKVTTYEKDLATGSAKTAQAWAALNTQQKDMAIGLHGLGTEFSAVQKAAGPDILRVFNAGLSQAINLLPELVPLAHATSFALAGIITQIGSALSDSQAKEFFAFVEKNIGPDMQQIGDTVVSLLRLFFNLVESLQPVSLALLHIVSGLAGFLAELSKVAPWLIDIAVLSIALYKPLSALMALNMFGWASDAAAGVMLFAKATEGATIAERAMLLGELALDAVSPWVWAGLAVAGLAALILVTRQNSDATGIWVSNMAKADQATGFNVAGYQKLTAGLGQARQAQTQLNNSVAAHNAVGKQLGDALVQQTVRTSELTQAQRQSIITGSNLSINLGIIQSAYGLTRDQAIKLTTEAGVNAKQLGASGAAGATAAGKVLAFGKATNTAAGATNSMALAVQGLTNSITLLITPLLTAEGDQVSWKQAQQAATAAINANTHSLDSNKASALAARAAIVQSTTAALNDAEAQAKLHGNMGAANAIIQDQIHWLQVHAGKSQIARDEIAALRKEEAQLKNINQQINVNGSGRFSVQGSGLPGGIGHHVGGVAAEGLFIPGVNRGVDDQLIAAQAGELIVPKRIVDAGRVNHLRGEIPGFAAGGVVGSHSGLAGMGPWLGREDSATVTAIDQAVAAAFKAAFLAAASSFGAAGPGGGAPSANAALARKMYPGEDFASWNYVAMRESGWSQYARNQSSGAYGIPQALPESKLPFAGQQAGGSNPAAQISWMEGYMRQRYGGAAGAAAHERAFNWYDNGGWMPSGSFGLNSSGKPEPVFSNAQWQILAKSVQGGDGASAAGMRLEGKMDKLIDAVGASAARTGKTVGAALNGASVLVANRSRYQAGT